MIRLSARARNSALRNEPQQFRVVGANGALYQLFFTFSGRATRPNCWARCDSRNGLSPAPARTHIVRDRCRLVVILEPASEV